MARQKENTGAQRLAMSKGSDPRGGLFPVDFYSISGPWAVIFVICVSKGTEVKTPLI